MGVRMSLGRMNGMTFACDYAPRKLAIVCGHYANCNSNVPRRGFFGMRAPFLGRKNDTRVTSLTPPPFFEGFMPSFHSYRNEGPFLFPPRSSSPKVSWLLSPYFPNVSCLPSLPQQPSDAMRPDCFPPFPLLSPPQWGSCSAKR